MADQSLDFVYLDARHDFQGVFSDLIAWWPKLRIGGVIAGHDYCDGELPEGDFFVQTAVQSFLGTISSSTGGDRGDGAASTTSAAGAEDGGSGADGAGIVFT